MPVLLFEFGFPVEPWGNATGRPDSEGESVWHRFRSRLVFEQIGTIFPDTGIRICINAEPGRHSQFLFDLQDGLGVLHINATPSGRNNGFAEFAFVILKIAIDFTIIAISR